LLLLILLVGGGVARVWRRELVLLQFAGVICGVGASFRSIFWATFVLGRASFAGRAALPRAAFAGGALYSPPACLVATTPVLKSPGLAVAAMGGLPWLAEARSSGLLRAA